MIDGIAVAAARTVYELLASAHVEWTVLGFVPLLLVVAIRMWN